MIIEGAYALFIIILEIYKGSILSAAPSSIEGIGLAMIL